MSNYFQGKERLEELPALARKIRMGSPAELRIPDHQRVTDALKSSNFEQALNYLSLFHPQNQLMLAMVFEWVLQIPQSLNELTDSDTHSRITAESLRVFNKLVPTINSTADLSTGATMLAGILNGTDLNAESAENYRQQTTRGERHLLQDILDELDQRYSDLILALEQADVMQSIKKLDKYRFFTIGVHDACLQFIQSGFEQAQLECGQELCEQVIKKSFSSCSFFEPLWEVGKLPADALAAFLAEHLRFHFSGDDLRGGSVEIIEDDEKYRLIFDACGSGGAMRRRLAANSQIATLPEASPATWGRAGEVPAYCAHCAFNEMTAIEKYGYPILVTEFNPDPMKPCGWTVYKDPADIPQSVYQRLGKAKPA